MLCCHYGASTLAKTIRRPIVSKLAMNTKETAATFATESICPTTAKNQGVRNISQSARQSVSKTWSPQHGIVFGTGLTPGGFHGLSTAASGDFSQDLHLNSDAEDNYVLADAVKVDPQSISNVEKTKKTDGVSAENADVAAVAYPVLPTEPELEDPEQNELPETSTSYKMSEEIFRAAKNAQPGSPGSFWSHILYRSPAGAGLKPKKPTVHYCRSKLTTERVLKAYFMKEKILGFDIEWKSEQRFRNNKGPRQNVSLIQIACEDRIALFHLAMYPKGDTIEDLVSPLLKQILEDPGVTKVGVAIRGDCTRVKKHLNIQVQGMFELSHLNKLVKFSKTKDFSKINKSLVSLAKQVQEHLHLPMSKATEVRSSDWSRSLDLYQILYAATDSYAGFQLYHTMELKRKALDPVPPRPYHAELDKPIRFVGGVEIPVDNEVEEVEGEELETAAPTKRKYTKRTAKELAVDVESISMEDVEPVGNPADLDADYVLSSQSSTTTTSSSQITDSRSMLRASRITTPSAFSLLETATALTISHFASTYRPSSVTL